MKKVTISRETVETDVLCIGGGIAGLMAAIRAAECGAKVLVAEKANVISSGSGGLGNDHFMCHIPEVHGADVEPLVEEFQRGQQGGLRPRSFIRTWLERSSEMVGLWDDWGIPMKYNGGYEFAGHALPGHPLMNLHYAGKDQKRILAREAVKRGAVILNRLMCQELIVHGDRVLGALCLDVKEDRLIVVRAKGVVIGTGSVMRLYPASTPAWMFNTRLSPTCVGDGRAMAYRSGIELASMEIPLVRCGPKFFARAGKATWAGVLRDPTGKPVGPFVTRPDNKYGDPVVDVYQDIFLDYKRSGRGPVYMDCDGLSDAELGYMLHWLRHEGNSSFLRHLEEEGIDVRGNPVEFWTYESELFPRGGILYNDSAETSLPGVYAAGDEFFGGISGAAVFGWIAGEGAASFARHHDHGGREGLEGQVKRSAGIVKGLRNRGDGPSWKEANILLQQIMWDYAGPVRSKTLLEAGLAALRRLKNKAEDTMVAANPHELMRCLEVINMIDLGELIFEAATRRTETRGKHIRVDYPFTNPLMEQLLVVRKSEGAPVFAWRTVRR